MFYGLKIHHTKEHLTRAVVEGISFSLLMISEAIELANDKIDDIYASGIVVRSDWWLQMIADMFGKRVLLNDATDASAMGAAFMAMYATGMITDLTQVRSFLRPYKTFSPVPRTRDTYQSQFECFKSLIRMQTR
jgi:gluconokinase